MDKDEFFSQYQSEEWNKLSKRIMIRDHFTCQICGKKNVKLNVHHLYYPKDGHILEVPDSALITVCEDCHNKLHEQRKLIYPTIQLLREKVTDFELIAILRSIYNGALRLEIDSNGRIILPLLSLNDSVTDTSNLINTMHWHRRIQYENI